MNRLGEMYFVGAEIPVLEAQRLTAVALNEDRSVASLIRLAIKKHIESLPPTKPAK